jgi:hypothetical protein
MREALALLSQEPPTAVKPSTPNSNLESEFDDDPDPSGKASVPLSPPSAPLTIGLPSAASPLLDTLETSRHPQQKTACEICPNSVWFSSLEEVKCNFRVMYLVAWSSQAPNQITHFDGLYLAQEEGWRPPPP